MLTLFSVFPLYLVDKSIPSNMDNINNITKASLLHKKSIKRFVNEYFGEGHETVIINPSSSDKKSIFNLYILYFIGKSEIEVIDDNSFGPMSRKSTS